MPPIIAAGADKSRAAQRGQEVTRTGREGTRPGRAGHRSKLTAGRQESGRSQRDGRDRGPMSRGQRRQRRYGAAKVKTRAGSRLRTGIRERQQAGAEGNGHPQQVVSAHGAGGQRGGDPQHVRPVGAAPPRAGPCAGRSRRPAGLYMNPRSTRWCCAPTSLHRRQPGSPGRESDRHRNQASGTAPGRSCH